MPAPQGWQSPAAWSESDPPPSGLLRSGPRFLRSSTAPDTLVIHLRSPGNVRHKVPRRTTSCRCGRDNGVVGLRRL